MTDLLHTIPDFPIKHYTHLLPSLERSLVTVTDLLTLDALDLAKKAQLPLLDVRRLKEHVLATLQRQLGLENELSDKFEGQLEGAPQFGELKTDGNGIVQDRGVISTLDQSLDGALDGGIQTGYVTDITGESGAGKTQFLLTLLLSAQLPAPHGLNRQTCYISTEHSLPTNRLDQILTSNSILTSAASQNAQRPPSLSRVLTLQTPDLESQDHILTYQLPIALVRHQVGLVIIDSIAANYRAERSENASSFAAALATRSGHLLRLGALLQRLAREHNCAIVVSNQVADRFDNPLPTHNPSSSAPSQNTSAGPKTTTTAAAAGAANTATTSIRPNAFSSSPAPSNSSTGGPSSATHVLSLDHQQRFFTGWGDDPYNRQPNLKTPSLGLVWANQIACRITLIKERAFTTSAAGTSAPTKELSGTVSGGMAMRGARSGQDEYDDDGDVTAEWAPRHWQRWMRVVFAPWVAGVGEVDKGVEFEVWAGGLRGVVKG